MIIPNNKIIIITLYTLLMVCMGFATIIERLSGEGASSSVYGSWWFIGLWTALTAVSVVFLFQQNVHHRLAVMLLHVSFVIILAGALVTHLTSERGNIHLRKGCATTSFVNNDGNTRPLPFTMTMTDFGIQYYPGTDAVMDYRCDIEVKNGDRKEQMTVAMNNIGNVSGYRFYQSAYDSDYEGSQLLVAYDPYGIAITYLGYVLLLVSLLWTVFSRHTRIRELYGKATRPLAVALLFFIASATVKAQSQVTPVSKEIADEFGQVAVLYNGRICPVNTAAMDFVTKLSGKSSWNGLSANEIFLSWMIYYTEWEQQPIIRIKNAEVQHLLGIDDEWATVRDFYNNKEYKLSAMMNDTSLPASLRNAIRDTDEKLQVVSMFYNSEMLHIFPLTVGGKTAWYTPGSTELPLGTLEAEFQFINHAMDHLTQSILVNDIPRSKQIIAKIRLYQREKASAFMPSSSMLRAEMFYNHLQQARWTVYLYLLLSIMLCLLSLTKGHSKVVRYASRSFVAVALLWLSSLLVLRWLVSGHAPMSNGHETMLFMAWVILLVAVVVSRKMPVLMSLSPVASAFCMLVATIAVGNPQITNLMPVLQSPLLSIHVALVMMAYALFAIITLLTAYSLALSLWRQEELGTDELCVGMEQERITAMSNLLLYPAVALLAIGIFVGAVWANISWGTYWSWDPKETWALITLMVYALPLHRSFVALSQRTFNAYLLIAFLAVLVTYFGVNYFLPGMHSYA